MMLLAAKSFGDRFSFSFSRKGKIGEGERAHPKGANTMVASRLSCRNDLVSTGRAIFVLFGKNGVKNKQSHLFGPPFPAFKAHVSAIYGRFAFLERRNWMFVNWWVWLKLHIP